MSQTAAKPVLPLPLLKGESLRGASAPDAAGQPSVEDYKRSFLRMLSHELRTPLNAVIGFSEIITSELYGPLGAPQYKEYAEMIRTSGHRLLKLVNQVLEIARLDGGAVDMRLEHEALDHAFEDVLTQMGGEIAAHRLKVTIHGEGALPVVIADGRGLRTLLHNLLQNAVAWSPEGGRIDILTEADNDSVSIAIADQGPGIAAVEMDRLLQPFEQGEEALTRSNHGAGLGLPIVQLLCHAMNGSFRLNSEPGKGLTAVVRLRRG